MPKTDFPTVPDGAARSVASPTQGWQDISTTTSKESVDMSAWAGKYITFEAEVDDHYIAFTDDATDAIDLTAATVGSPLVPKTIYAGLPSPPMVVPIGKTILLYRTVTSAGPAVLRATRS